FNFGIEQFHPVWPVTAISKHINDATANRKFTRFIYEIHMAVSIVHQFSHQQLCIHFLPHPEVNPIGMKYFGGYDLLDDGLRIGHNNMTSISIAKNLIGGFRLQQQVVAIDPGEISWLFETVR